MSSSSNPHQIGKIDHIFVLVGVKRVLVASPGFLQEDFFKYLFDVVVVNSDKHRGLLKHKDKFVLLRSASGHKGALAEVLKEASIKESCLQNKGTKALFALDNFQKMLKSDPQRASYG